VGAPVHCVPREGKQIDGSSQVVVVPRFSAMSSPNHFACSYASVWQPTQANSPVGDFALSLIEGEELSHPQRDESLPQDVLHRLPEPQVRAERDRGNEFGEADLARGQPPRSTRCPS
jgi:hypothetical protein